MLAFETFSVLAASVALAGASGSTPHSCRWCEDNTFDRGVREAFLIEDSRTPAVASHVLSVGVCPALAWGGLVWPALQRGRSDWALQDSVVVVNAFALASGLAYGTKNLAARERPGFRFARQSETEAWDNGGERYLSFFSADTAWAFAFVSSGATLAAQRGYGTAPVVAVAGGAAAVATGILRISADMHWATDVLTGAAVGTTIGVAGPQLLHARRERAPTRWLVVPALSRQFVGVAAAALL